MTNFDMLLNPATIKSSEPTAALVIHQYGVKIPNALHVLLKCNVTKSDIVSALARYRR